MLGVVSAMDLPWAGVGGQALLAGRAQPHLSLCVFGPHLPHRGGPGLGKGVEILVRSDVVDAEEDAGHGLRIV